MTLAEALDLAVAKTGCRRYRQLCDPSDPAYHAGYMPIVFAIARGEPLPTPAPTPPIEPRPAAPVPSSAPLAVLATELEALAIVARCPHARVCSCIHRGNIDCQPGGKRPGERLTVSQCRACLAGPA